MELTALIVSERTVTIPPASAGCDLLSHIEEVVLQGLADDQTPLRFVVTGSNSLGFDCELGVIEGRVPPPRNSIFRFARRNLENTSQFNVVLLVPTGIGAEIGGHAGDATPVAKLVASACDRLITHPNVVSASDINELPENGWYVEGSVLCRLLMGTVGLQRVRANRLLVIIDGSSEDVFIDAAINSVNAARATYGITCSRLIVLRAPFKMVSDYMPSGRAAGRIDGLEHITQILDEAKHEYDAVAISSQVDSPLISMAEYFSKSSEIVNPWGGVEALLTHAISTLYDVGSAHCPMFDTQEGAETYPAVVDPRIAAEAVSVTFFNCILKGLHRSPRIIIDPTLFTHHDVFTAADVSCLVIPDGCVGLPTLAALKQGIRVIAVRENRNVMQNNLTDLPWAPGQLHIVQNYLEAIGLLLAMKAGLSPESLRRPLKRIKEEIKAGAVAHNLQT